MRARRPTQQEAANIFGAHDYDLPGTKNAAMRSADAFLDKPATTDAFRKWLHELCEQSSRNIDRPSQ